MVSGSWLGGRGGGWVRLLYFTALNRQPVGGTLFGVSGLLLLLLSDSQNNVLLLLPDSQNECLVLLMYYYYRTARMNALYFYYYRTADSQASGANRETSRTGPGHTTQAKPTWAKRQVAPGIVIHYFCMTQETVRRLPFLPFRCYTRKGSDLDQSQQQRKR